MVFIEIMNGCMNECSHEHVVLDYDIFEDYSLEDLRGLKEDVARWIEKYPYATEMLQNYLDVIEENIQYAEEEEE